MKNINYRLLQQLCSIHAPSGNETAMTAFILDYIKQNKSGWKAEPEIFSGDGFQNCIVMVFGNPTTAVYAHLDNIGFTARYNNNLIKIGSPKIASGYKLKGRDSKGEIRCSLAEDEKSGVIKAEFNRIIEPGTDLSFDSEFREDENFVQSCYLDNRLGVFTALKISETITNGAIVFSCWEEHGGGSAGYLAKFLYEKYGVVQSLICDITWVTEGVFHGKGVAVSIRDSGIPRRAFVEKIKSVLKMHKVQFQLEVESSGGSDGNEIQKIPYPIDWCFIGAPEDFVHSPDEKVHNDDIISMINAYEILLNNL